MAKKDRFRALEGRGTYHESDKLCISIISAYLRESQGFHSGIRRILRGRGKGYEAAMEGYTEGIRTMSDAELRTAWDREEDAALLRKLEHEMAMRFMFRRGTGGQREYFLDKFLRMPEEFREAYYAKDWFHAKYIYDSAIAVGRFVEAPESVRDQVFGSRQDEKNPMEGLFPDWMVHRVMHECVIRNRLGHECIVYRVPGEIGFYGARYLPGTRRMAAEENPAYRAAEGGGSREGG